MMKSSTIDFSIARLTVAAIAFPAATATTETELAMVKYGITAGPKRGARCGAKCAEKCGAKCAVQ